MEIKDFFHCNLSIRFVFFVKVVPETQQQNSFFLGVIEGYP